MNYNNIIKLINNIENYNNELINYAKKIIKDDIMSIDWNSFLIDDNGNIYYDIIKSNSSIINIKIPKQKEIINNHDYKFDNNIIY